MACCKGCAVATYLRGVGEGMERGLAGLGALDAATYNAYSSRYQAALREWNGRGFTAAQGVRALDGVRTSVAAMYAKFWDDIIAKRVKAPVSALEDIKRIRAQLDSLRNLLASKGLEPYVFKSPHKTWNDVRLATTAPLAWQMSLASASSILVDADRKVYADLLRAVRDLPSNVVAAAVRPVAYVVEQAARGVGDGLGVKVPSWFVPAALGLGALVVVGPYVRPLLRRM